ncbi:hypothetical protein AAGV28_06970 [Flavobacterium sp. FZUC8N2.13]|uniref:GyrI-like small molecule binding domain-containing protein n=1 Tax=Flavobacterium zubiriense TaxID=3138075 RepID=A0ABV4TAJ0_9FLAO
MTQDNNIIEIPVKVILTGEFNNFDSWIKNTQELANKYGVNSKLLHQDKNGFATNGYELRNHQHTKPYPVKTYLLVQDPAIEKPLPYQSNN